MRSMSRNVILFLFQYGCRGSADRSAGSDLINSEANSVANRFSSLMRRLPNCKVAFTLAPPPPLAYSLGTVNVGSICFDASPVIFAWPGGYLGHCHPVGFAGRARFPSSVDARRMRASRGSHKEHQAPLGTPGYLRCSRHPLARVNAVIGGSLQCGGRCSRLGNRVLGADGQSVGDVSSSCGCGGASKIGCNNHGAPNLVGRMVVGPIAEHHGSKEVATDVRGERECRTQVWCLGRIGIPVSNR